jgi:hypothetical protein
MIQKRVAAAIAAQVQATLTPEQQATLQSNRLINPDAYQAYLRALSLSRTIDGLQRSVAYLNQAIEKQPNYPKRTANWRKLRSYWAICSLLLRRRLFPQQ